MGACIEPCDAATHDLDIEIAALHVGAVYVADLDLATCRRLYGRSNIEDAMVVEVKPGDRQLGPRLQRLFLDRYCLAARVELDHAVALGIGDDVAKNRGSHVARCGTF